MFLFGLMIASTFTFAQAREGKTSNYPYWTVSKEVQRFQHRDEVFQPATIRVGNVVSSKGVSQVASHRQQAGRVAVVMNGTPSHVISKGVARMQYEKR